MTDIPQTVDGITEHTMRQTEELYGMPREQMNVNRETGIRYGYGYRVPDALFEEAFHNGTDLAYEAFKDHMSEKLTTAIMATLKDYALDCSGQTIIDNHVEEIVDYVVTDADTCGDEGHYYLENDTIKAEIIGNEYIVLWSSKVVLCHLCSPCALNGGDLSTEGGNGYQTYAVPDEWQDEA